MLKEKGSKVADKAKATDDPKEKAELEKLLQKIQEKYSVLKSDYEKGLKILEKSKKA